MNIDAYKHLRDRAEVAKRNKIRAEGELISLLKTLKKEYQCSSLKEARRMYESATRKEARAEQKFEDLLGAFTRKWKHRLEDSTR